jgi:hypothetical protein
MIKQLFRSIPVWVIRAIGAAVLLLGLHHIAAIAFMTALGRSQLLFTYIVFGVVLSVVGIWIVCADLRSLFNPNRYDLIIGCIALIILIYYVSWIFGERFWSRMLTSCFSSTAKAGQFVGVGFLITFLAASFISGSHLVVVLSRPLREQLRPKLLSHLAALLLLLPSLRLGSQMRTIFGLFQ